MTLREQYKNETTFNPFIRIYKKMDFNWFDCATDQYVKWLEDKVNRVKPEVMPKIAEEDFENMRDLFWAMLRTLEGRVKPDEDILDKRDVEAGYRIWNKIFKNNLKPSWED
jgi:hypothetical protein